MNKRPCITTPTLEMSIEDVFNNIISRESLNNSFITYKSKAELCKKLFIKNTYGACYDNFSLYVSHLVLKIILIICVTVFILSPFFLNIDIEYAFMLFVVLCIVASTVYSNSQINTFFYSRREYLTTKKFLDSRLNDLYKLYQIFSNERYPTEEEMNSFTSDSLRPFN